MPNEGYVIVPTGLQAVHLWDLYGPLVQPTVLGKRTIELFRELSADPTERARLGIEESQVEEIVGNYQALVNGKPWTTGERKVGIIDAVEGPIKASGRPVSYEGVFYQDALTAMAEILAAGEQVSIFSSKYPDWLKANLPEELAERMGELYGDRKTQGAAFQRVVDLERQAGRHVVSHTADELPELVAARDSGVVPHRVYVARNDVNSRAAATEAGVHQFVTDMAEPRYTELVKR